MFRAEYLLENMIQLLGQVLNEQENGRTVSVMVAVTAALRTARPPRGIWMRRSGK